MFQKQLEFAPDFAKCAGLLPVVVQCAQTKEVLMLAYMNEEAYKKTVSSGEAWYWSRSRQSLWHKGGTSGHVQKVLSMRLDCDSDALVLLVEQIGDAACHTGHRSCFYTEWCQGNISCCSPYIFDPKEVYK